MLSYRLISKEDHPKLRRLLEESFPPEETLPFEFYVSDFRNLGIHVEGAYRENELVGFLHYVVRPEFVYLAFFAFFPKERGKGYGRESLAYLKSLFSDRPICIDRELIDPSLPDNAIRVKRREFYMRSGLFDQNSYQVQNGIIFQTMSTPGFKFAPLKATIDELSSGGDPRYRAYYFQSLEEAESFRAQWQETIEEKYREWLESQDE